MSDIRDQPPANRPGRERAAIADRHSFFDASSPVDADAPTTFGRQRFFDGRPPTADGPLSSKPNPSIQGQAPVNNSQGDGADKPNFV
jgi:hypothetical protein